MSIDIQERMNCVEKENSACLLRDLGLFLIF